MDNYIPLSSLAMDLKRSAIGYHGSSPDMAERFYSEALKRGKEIDRKYLPPYLINLLDDVEKLQEVEDDAQKAEKSLTLSTLFQNAAIALTNGPTS